MELNNLNVKSERKKKKIPTPNFLFKPHISKVMSKQNLKHKMALIKKV